MNEPNLKRVYVLADGTGETADRVTRAALTQFKDLHVSLELFTRVRSKYEIREHMERAAHQGAFVVFTLLDRDHRNYILALAEELAVETVDLIGGLVLQLGRFFEKTPMFTPGLRHQLNADYFRRVEAVEFAVKSDDGQSPANLRRAEIVLVGLSRTSKTPLSMYLAHKGYRVANVPLVPDIPPPKELLDIDQDKIFALIIDLNTLVRVRTQRLRQLGLPPDADYAARSNIATELRWVRDYYAHNPSWPVIDTSGRAVEETAAEILRIMKERQRILPDSQTGPLEETDGER